MNLQEIEKIEHQLDVVREQYRMETQRYSNLVRMAHASITLLNLMENHQTKKEVWTELKKLYENAGFEL